MFPPRWRGSSQETATRALTTSPLPPLFTASDPRREAFREHANEGRPLAISLVDDPASDELPACMLRPEKWDAICWRPSSWTVRGILLLEARVVLRGLERIAHRQLTCCDNPGSPPDGREGTLSVVQTSGADTARLRHLQARIFELVNTVDCVRDASRQRTLSFV